jgi:5-methylcytosine-specific restriction endonuclease McrA
MKKQIREQIFNKYSGKCAYCGTGLEKGWHVDHIEPVVRDSKWSRYHGRFVTTQFRIL